MLHFAKFFTATSWIPGQSGVTRWCLSAVAAAMICIKRIPVTTPSAPLPLSVAAEPAAGNRLADTVRPRPRRYRHIPELISGVNIIETVYGDKCLQLFHELNLQLDCSIKAVFSHFNRMCDCVWFISLFKKKIYISSIHHHSLSLFVLLYLLRWINVFSNNNNTCWKVR